MLGCISFTKNEVPEQRNPSRFVSSFVGLLASLCETRGLLFAYHILHFFYVNAIMPIRKY
jgi:hypothetical protein